MALSRMAALLLLAVRSGLCQENSSLLSSPHLAVPAASLPELKEQQRRLQKQQEMLRTEQDQLSRKEQLLGKREQEANAKSYLLQQTSARAEWRRQQELREEKEARSEEERLQRAKAQREVQGNRDELQRQNQQRKMKQQKEVLLAKPTPGKTERKMQDSTSVEPVFGAPVVTAPLAVTNVNRSNLTESELHQLDQVQAQQKAVNKLRAQVYTEKMSNTYKEWQLQQRQQMAEELDKTAAKLSWQLQQQKKQQDQLTKQEYELAKRWEDAEMEKIDPQHTLITSTAVRHGGTPHMNLKAGKMLRRGVVMCVPELQTVQRMQLQWTMHTFLQCGMDTVPIVSKEKHTSVATDLVIFTTPPFQQQLEKMCKEHSAKVQDDLSECIVVAQDVPENAPVHLNIGEMGRVNAMLGPKAGFLHHRYTYLLLTHVGAFFTPRMASWMPTTFTVGQRKGSLLPQRNTSLWAIAKSLKFDYVNATQLGSTWYGNAEDIMGAVQATQKAAQHLFTTDPLATQSLESITQTVAYAIELGVNHVAGVKLSMAKEHEHYKTAMLDADGHSDVDICSTAHILSGSEAGIFNQEEFFSHQYDDIAPSVHNLNISIASRYALHAALVGTGMANESRLLSYKDLC